MVSLEGYKYLLSMLFLSNAISLNLFFLTPEFRINLQLSLLSRVKKIDPFSLPFLVLLLPHFHELPMAHLFLLVYLLLGFELFRCRFGPDALLALAKP